MWGGAADMSSVKVKLRCVVKFSAAILIGGGGVLLIIANP
jgi:hypothetical protein